MDELESGDLSACSAFVTPVWVLSTLGEFLDRASGDASEVADLGVVAVGVA